MKVDSPILRHRLVPVIACCIIAVVELGLDTGWFAFGMAVLLVAFGSRIAQILWASVLLVRLVLLVTTEGSLLVMWVGPGFLAIRILFLAVLAASGILFGTHTLTRALRVRVQAARPPIWLGLAVACLIICAGLVFFDFDYWYLYASWVALFFVLAWRCPKPVRRGRSTWTDRAINGTLLLVVLVLCLILVEVGVRVFVPPPAYSVKGTIFRAHETAGFTLLENASQTHKTAEFEVAYSISSQGLRDRIYGRKEVGVFRIVCLGDSFTMGYGVHDDEPYPKVLESDLSQRYPDRTIEVVNLGTPGYGLWQSAIKFREIGLDLEPDLLVVQVLPENDVRDRLRREGMALRSYNAGYHRSVDNWHRLQNKMASSRLRSLSRAHDLLLYAFQPEYEYVLSKLRPQFGGGTRRQRIVWPSVRERRPPSMETLLRESYPDLDLGFSLLEQTMVELAELCEDKGIEMVVLHIGSRGSIYVDATAEWLDNQGIDASIYDFGRVSRWMDQVCSDHGWPLVNTMERLAERAKTVSDDLIYPRDGHPTAKGHQLVAASLGDYLDGAYFRTGSESDSLLPERAGDAE